VYFVGATVAVAISVSWVRPLKEPLNLSELRRRSPTFHVPQSYRFMDEDELVVVLNGERYRLFGDPERGPIDHLVESLL
jgi:hypothetical protein